MTRHVCYLARADRGDRIVAVRLVGAQTDESWAAPASNPEGAEGAEAVFAAAAGAAAWVAERLGGARALDLVCLDGQGSVCSPLTAPSRDSAVVEAAYALAGGASLGGGDQGPSMGGLLVQALGEAGTERGAEGTGSRLAVAALRDSAARLFLDALDERGVSVGGVVSIWHALAHAWDGSKTPGSAKSERVVATASPVTAMVMLDPAGSAVWTWSHEGRALVGGALRVARLEVGDNGTTRAALSVGEADIGRLTVEWLTWAAQLGRAPARVVCIVPEMAGGGLTPGQVGTSIGRAWPMAAVDMAVHEDPVGALLKRLARDDEGASPGGGEAEGLERLTRRPSRAHRGMYVWASALLIALALGLGLVGLRLRQAAADLREQRVSAEAETRAAILQAAPDLAASPLIEREFQARLERMRVPEPGAEKAVRPVLAELQTVVLLLADWKAEGVEPIEIILDQNQLPTVHVSVPRTEVGERLLESAREMPSSISWLGKFGPAPGAGKQRYTLFGSWPDRARDGP